jgi:type IV pilus assembly protein PilA
VNCPACGNPLAAGEQFCRVCGHATSAPAVSTPAGTTPAVVTGAPAKTSGKAIASFICGIFVFCFPASILAIIFGLLSLSDIRKSADRLKGKGLAIAGLVLGGLGILFIPVVLIIAAIAIPNLLRARMAANEASAVASVRTVATAEVTYASAHPDAGFTCSLADLATAGFIDQTLASGRRSGYNFELSGCSAGETAAMGSYRVVAYPVVPNQTGVRAFCADESAVIKVDASGSAQGCLESGSPLQ